VLGQVAHAVEAGVAEAGLVGAFVVERAAVA
jgi:hypothetical protein